ncbi:GTPase Der [Arthrobacter sp. Hiyo6]|nr:GTPase Der [Arthrobacter sp. Hiyo6]
MYSAHWNGRNFTIVDTGGWEHDARGIHARVAEQAEMAVELADAVLFVVDSAVGATATDEAVVKMLRKSKKPVIMVANKVDDFAQEADSATLWGLGFGEPYPVSALHGRGVATSWTTSWMSSPSSPPSRGSSAPAARAALPHRPSERRQILPFEQAGRLRARCGG